MALFPVKFCIVLFVCLLHNLIVFADDPPTGPAQPELVDSNNYIIVFKPNVNSIKIKSQIQRLKVHQISRNNTSPLYNTTNNTNSPIISPSKDSSSQYNSIGKFKWYSAQFHTETIEKLLNKTPSGNITAKLDDDNDDETVHYWIKDAKFSLQEFIQTNPPSWVKKIKKKDDSLFIDMDQSDKSNNGFRA